MTDWPVAVHVHGVWAVLPSFVRLDATTGCDRRTRTFGEAPMSPMMKSVLWAELGRPISSRTPALTV